MTLTLNPPLARTPDVVDDGTRRDFVVGGLSLGALLLTGCGDDARENTAGADSHGFPRTIEHAYGSTTIDRAPERLLALGFTDVDVALALGVTPVGFRDYFGSGLQPWAEPLVGTGDPVPLEYGEAVPVEEVLALRPDLIVANTGMTRQDYDALSHVVPTVAPATPDATAVAWRTQVERTAEALARETPGERLIRELEARYASARQAHPEFAGRTIAWTFPAQGAYSVYLARDNRIQVLTELGFELAPAIAELDNGTFSTTLSEEQIGKLDADVLIVQVYTPDQRRAVERSKLFQNLDVVRRGAVSWLSPKTADAVTFGTVLSVPVALDGLVPSLAQRVDQRTG